MTKKEVNPQNLSTSFKLKLTKKPQTAWKDKRRIGEGQGIYEQLSQNANKTSYNSGSFSLQTMQEAIGDFFQQRDQTNRNVKIVTNRAGKELFDQALLAEMQKFAKQNEHRKKLSFRSKILKQTYKFG